jgi:hypothetical protein
MKTGHREVQGRVAEHATLSPQVKSSGQVEASALMPRNILELPIEAGTEDDSCEKPCNRPPDKRRNRVKRIPGVSHGSVPDRRDQESNEWKYEGGGYHCCDSRKDAFEVDHIRLTVCRVCREPNC